MNALPAAAEAILSGAADSLGQFAASPWALVPLAVAVIVGGGCIWYARRPGHVVIAAPELPAVPPCPCCTGRPMEFSDCTCREDCGVVWCQANEVGDMDAEIEQWLKGGGRG